ncbi:MAG: helix-turn-helix transcriptional regulator [Actinobacteria bacterium]|nr:helix-turn-helix transcriptional regulator [Actinomycetota bacterium]
MSDRFSVSLGQRLRAARRQRGWSLGEVESQTEGEFKASVVGAYERGERAISVQRFARLSDVYGIHPNELLPVEPAENLVVDLNAIESGDGDDLVERYLAAIQLLRSEPGKREVRQSDRAIIASLLRVAEHRTEDESTRPNL